MREGAEKVDDAIDDIVNWLVLRLVPRFGVDEVKVQGSEP